MHNLKHSADAMLLNKS